MAKSFQETFESNFRRSNFTTGQLKRLTGIPKRTILNWLEGVTRKPRHWQDVVRIAAAMKLDESEATELLISGHLPSVIELRRLAKTNEQKLLELWRPAKSPFQAYNDFAYFVGREKEIREISEVLLNGNFVSIYNLRGMAGVGKTTLANHLAYLLRPYFPDGVLWAQVGASDTMSILGSFAHEYGQDVNQLTDLASRASVVRSLLANKRVLIILDNVESSEQVNPLIPPSTGKPAVIITTRNDLTATDGFVRFHIQPFDSGGDDSIRLFEKYLDKAFIQQYRTTLSDIAELLGHLPLALAIAAGRIANDPNIQLESYLQQLRKEGQRLEALKRDVLSVRMSFEQSFQALAPDLQSFFASLGVFGGKDFGIEAVAYVTETEENISKNKLELLVKLSLIQVGRDDRFQLHPLLKEFTKEKKHNSYLKMRMVEYYIGFVNATKTNLNLIDIESGNLLSALSEAHKNQFDQLFLSGAIDSFTYLTSRGLYEVARTIYEQALPIAKSLGDINGQATILYCLGYFAGRLRNNTLAEEYCLQALSLNIELISVETIIDLKVMLGGMAFGKGNLDRAEKIWLEALELSLQVRHPVKISSSANNLGIVNKCLGNFPEAMKYYKLGITYAEKADDKKRMSALLLNLGEDEFAIGNWEEAKKNFDKAVELTKLIGHKELYIFAIRELGLLAYAKGDFKLAESFFTEGAETSKEMSHKKLYSLFLTDSGNLAKQDNQWGKAEKNFLSSLNLARETQYYIAIHHALVSLGQFLSEQGQPTEAEIYLQEALEVINNVNDPKQKSEVLNSWGEFELRKLNSSRSEEWFRQALECANKYGFREFAAWALFGLARCQAFSSQSANAKQYGQKSWKIYSELGHYKSQEVKEWLSKLRE